MTIAKRVLSFFGRLIQNKLLAFFFATFFIFRINERSKPIGDLLSAVLVLLPYVFLTAQYFSSIRKQAKVIGKLILYALFIALSCVFYYYGMVVSSFTNIGLVLLSLISFSALATASILLFFINIKSVLRFIKKKKFPLLCIFTILYIVSLEFRLYGLYSDNGGYSKFFCSETLTKQVLKKNVVRILGTEGQGSGFFISPGEVITNFHVVNSEMSPKVILLSGKFLTAERIKAYKDYDLAVIYTKEQHPELVLNLAASGGISENQVLIAAGFPLGTDIKGEPTFMKGKFLGFRKLKDQAAEYIQTNISLVQGMSGGPAVEPCGKVVGINTLGVSGLSFLIRLNQIDRTFWNNFTDTEQTKVQLDPSKSPEEAVRTFYTYLKTRRMEDGFNLLSNDAKAKTNFQEWTGRYPDVIDVYVYKVEIVPRSKDTVFIKFMTRNWVNNDDTVHYYEGTWQTVKENGKFKLFKSKIKEVLNPESMWFYE